MRAKKNRKKLKLLIGLLFVIAIVLGLVIINEHNRKINHKIFVEEQNKIVIANIKSHYSNLVEIVTKTPLYVKKGDKMVKKGFIGQQEKVALAETKIDKIALTTLYFKLKDFDYYVYYQAVEPTAELLIKSDRYKNYLLFNENIVTKEKTSFYRGDSLVYVIDDSLDLPIIMKDDNGFYVEYLGEMLLVKKEDVQTTHPASNTDLEEANQIPVTVYHFIYLEGDKTCNEIICHPESQIKEHFNYLKENNFFTLNTTELRLYLENKLRLPKKSILITIDDGARAWHFVPLLDKYQVNATLFLISSWYETSRFSSKYLEIASHTHNLHNSGVCPGGRGSAIKCLEKSKLLSDLKKSREVLEGTEAFCYPFYDYNDYAIGALKEAGFKMAFAGGQRKVRKGVDLFKIPRITISRNTTLKQYIKYVN